MPDKKINIVYIDDNSDEILSQYMNKEYCATPFQQPDITQIEKVYKEVRFCGDEGYVPYKIGKLQIQGFSEPTTPNKIKQSYHITQKAARSRPRAAFLRGKLGRRQDFSKK